MMTKLALSLEKWLEKGGLRNGVVASVRRIAEPSGALVKGSRPEVVIIPVGGRGEDKVVDVYDPGR